MSILEDNRIILKHTHMQDKKQLGTIISSIGGLLVIFSMTAFDNGFIEFVCVVGGAALAVIGVLIIQKAKQDE